MINSSLCQTVPPLTTDTCTKMRRPSIWCVGAVLNVAWCAVCASVCLCCSSSCLLALLGAPFAHPLLPHPPAPPYGDFTSPHDVDCPVPPRPASKADCPLDNTHLVPDTDAAGFKTKFIAKLWFGVLHSYSSAGMQVRHESVGRAHAFQGTLSDGDAQDIIMMGISDTGLG